MIHPSPLCKEFIKSTKSPYKITSEGHSSQAPSHLPECYAGHKEAFFQSQLTY